jgi:hypothetical protein
MMKRKANMTRLAWMAAVALSATVMATSAVAQSNDQIYGSQLMTTAERNDYRERIRSMKTEQEREAYRLEHHKQMQERARERGVALPAEPPARRGGGGPGPGPGMGGGMGGGPGGPGGGGGRGGR